MPRAQPPATRLVLGGGGLSGGAWMIGLIHGFEESGRRLRTACGVVGTSAGATVGAQLLSSTPTNDLFERQVVPRLQLREPTAGPDQMQAVVGAFTEAARIVDREPRLRWLGRRALAGHVFGEDERRVVIRARLASDAWPVTPLSIPAVDAATGALRVFDKASRVGLVDAIAASSAVPVLCEPVTIGGRRYIDGGVRSPDNVDLVTEGGRVLVLSPAGGAGDHGQRRAEHIQALRARGVKVELIEPDQRSRLAMGANAADPNIRAAAAHAGRLQALQLAEGP